jgi:rSAM/selenodomain-associated transferase 2
MRQRLSIIVPVYNEAAQVRPFLRHLRSLAPGAEIVVVDGESRDGTFELAVGYCDVLLRIVPGRPAQLNAGVRASCGEFLWFLHVDCEIPREGLMAVWRTLERSSCVGGCFRVRLLDRRWIFRVHDGLAHWIGVILRVRCGDHGIFCTRQVFDKIGGYREVPLMEDVEFVRALHREGPFNWLSLRITLSTRRHNQVGPYWYTFVCSAVVGLYCLGVSCEDLASLYRYLVSPRERASKRRHLPAVENELFSDFRTSSEPPHSKPVGGDVGRSIFRSRRP